MPQDIWDQKTIGLIDVPLADDGAKYGHPGETLIVDETRGGLKWAQAGGPGSVGPATNLTIGTVTGGDTAAVTIEGEAPSQVLNFVLPKGDPGSQGPQGIQGIQGPAGGPGPQGPVGPGTLPDEYGNLTEAKIAQIQTADVDWIFIVNPDGDDRANPTVPESLSGDMSRHMLRYDATLNEWTDFGIWTGLPGAQGAVGATGPAGPAGPGASFAIGTVTTGTPSVTLTGSAPNYSMNFVLPPGVPGANGANGAAGPTGATGPQGPAYIATSGAATSNGINFAAGSLDWVTRTATGAATWTFFPPPTGTNVITRFLELTNGGLGAQSFPASVKWSEGVVPELQTAGTDILCFVTRDGGTTYIGTLWAGNIS